MEKHQCAITRSNIDGTPKYSYTCFSHTSLLKIAADLNKFEGTEKIPVNKYLEKKKKRELYHIISKHIAKYCHNQDETCWASQKFITDEYTKEMTFRPIIPKTKYAWLSSLDLLAIGKQYEMYCDQVYKDDTNKFQKFHFLGVFPIDFEIINVYMKNLNLAKLIKKGYKHIGMILNLDRHNQSGSHWVAYFLDLSKDIAQQYYYDSVSNPPPLEVYTFADRIYKDLQKLNIKVSDKKLIYNYIRSQYKNSECGVYSWMFIQRLLEGKTFEEIISNVIDDDAMNVHRLQIFRQPTGYNPSEFHYVL